MGQLSGDSCLCLCVLSTHPGKVRHIYDTVTDELMADASRRFISVEQAYVYRWWNDPSTKATRVLLAMPPRMCASAFMAGSSREICCTNRKPISIHLSSKGASSLCWEAG